MKTFFMNDYGEGAHPLVMRRLMETNMEHTCGYGLDEYSLRAADVIRELGYPSREALRMCHRDWPDEQAAGEPSHRVERSARYTDDQKRAAVDHYLTHARRAGRPTRQMGYTSKQDPDH